MHRINGQKDPVIRLLRDLQVEDGRRREGRFFAEGEKLCLRAFEYGGKVESLLVTDKFASAPGAADLLARAGTAKADIYVTTTGLLSKILDAKPTPECIAIVERQVIALPQAFVEENPLVVMVERGENADNLGMLLRSAEAAGASAAVLSADTTDPFSRRVVRGSRGAVFTIPICIQHSAENAIEEAKRSGLQVIAASAQSETNYTDIDYTQPTMIVVGNEHVGISEEVREAADAVVRIPMRGQINSLNIAVAASVLLYEAVRLRA